MTLPIHSALAPRLRVLSVLIGILQGGISFGWAAAVSSAASSPVTITNSDVLLLESGETLRGKVLNERLSFRTAYARIELSKAWVASLDLVNDARQLSTLTTINSNRITGFLEDDFLVVQDSGGVQREIRRARIARFTPGRAKPESLKASTSNWVRLRNGDLLSGRISPNPLPLLITNVQTQLNLDGLTGISFSRSLRAGLPDLAGGTRGIVGTLVADYLVVELDAGPRLEIFRDAVEALGPMFAPFSSVAPEQQPGDVGVDPPPGVPPTSLEGLVWIPPGEFIMGSPQNEAGRDMDEGPQLRVRIPRGFWIGKCEVSQAEYEKITGTNPSPSTEDPTCPVVKVSWFEAMEYCAKLTKQRESQGRLPAGYAFRLPTEAEWEYACRAGTSSRFSFGEDKSDSLLGDYAWFARNSDFMAHPVGKKKANPWGLHDMHGNVLEWCLNRYERAPGGGEINMTATPASGSLRVARGGSWLYEAKACRSANRDDYGPSNRCSDIGLRVILAPLTP